MKNSQNVLEDIRDIFSILHDGTVSGWTGSSSLLTITVECEYLAERIDKSYKNFYVECEQVEKLELHRWLGSYSSSEPIYSELKNVFEGELLFLSAEIENDMVEIVCNQPNRRYEHHGGSLLLKCKEIRVYDEAKNQLTIDELDKICNEYWDWVSREIEQSILDSRREEVQSGC